jgi:hypothetical protein
MAFRTAGTPQGPAGSGIDCFLMQDNTTLGYAINAEVSEDYALEGVQSLGYFGFRDFLATGYNVDINMETLLLRGANIADSLSLPGWQSDGNNNINSSGLYTFTCLDIHTLIVLYTIIGSKYGGGNLTTAIGSLLRRGTRWKARQLLPGLQTS